MERFLEEAELGGVPKIHAILRRIAGVCAPLPAVCRLHQDAARRAECNDSAVVGYFTGVTSTVCALSDLVTKFSFAYDKLQFCGPDGRRQERAPMWLNTQAVAVRHKDDTIAPQYRLQRW